MRVASWNINSIRVRQERLIEWLKSREPDVLCLQEIKALETQFPSAAFRELGYESAVFGQKTYNGVAILSRLPMTEVARGFVGEEEGAPAGADGDGNSSVGTPPAPLENLNRDLPLFKGLQSVAPASPPATPLESVAPASVPAAPLQVDVPPEAAIEARLLAATIAGVRIHSVYVPNGRTIDSESYAHKLRWLGRLGEHLDRIERAQPLLLCGDFNVAPDERDLYNAAAFGQDVIFHQDVRDAFARLVGRGLVDTFRMFREEPGHFSWWDYRMLAFPKNRGLRIDLILASTDLVPRITAGGIDREARKGKLPSDHAPIWVEVS
jgi:exodeoxyribonuclease-3